MAVINGTVVAAVVVAVVVVVVVHFLIDEHSINRVFGLDDSSLITN